MPKSSSAVFFAFTILFLPVDRVLGDLIINVDSANETMFFSGSITVTTSGSVVRWQINSLSDFSTDGLYAFNIIAATSLPGISLTSASPGADLIPAVDNIQSFSSVDRFTLTFNELSLDTEYTFTAIPSRIYSYSGVADTAGKASWASLASANSIMPLSSGINASGNVIISAVPECSSLLVLSPFGYLLAHRRRVRSTETAYSSHVRRS